VSRQLPVAQAEQRSNSAAPSPPSTIPSGGTGGEVSTRGSSAASLPVAVSVLVDGEGPTPAEGEGEQ